MDFPHFGEIVSFERDGTHYWMKDSNWGGEGYRVHRMNINDPHILGFWAQ